MKSRKAMGYRKVMVRIRYIFGRHQFCAKVEGGDLKKIK